MAWSAEELLGRLFEARAKDLGRPANRARLPVFVAHYVEGIQERELTLPNERIGPISMETIANFCPENYFTSIDLSGNPIGDEGVPSLIDLLEINRTVEYLNLSSCAINTAGFVSLFKKLADMTSLKVLVVGNCGTVNRNYLRDKAFEALGDLLKSKHITKLSLDYMSVSRLGAVALSKSFEGNDSLKFLDMNGCNLTDDSLKALTSTMLNTQLERLSLANNKLTDIGAYHICRNVIQRVPTLSYLNLAHNKISTGGFRMLSLMLGYKNGEEEERRVASEQKVNNLKQDIEKQLKELHPIVDSILKDSDDIVSRSVYDNLEDEDDLDLQRLSSYENFITIPSPVVGTGAFYSATRSTKSMTGSSNGSVMSSLYGRTDMKMMGASASSVGAAIANTSGLKSSPQTTPENSMEQDYDERGMSSPISPLMPFSPFSGVPASPMPPELLVGGQSGDTAANELPSQIGDMVKDLKSNDKQQIGEDGPHEIYINLSYLNLSGNPLKPAPDDIFNALSSNVTLKAFYIGYCMLSEEAIRALAAGLTKNTTLERLDLSGNWARPGSYEPLFASILNNNTLKWLNISHCKIKDDSCNSLVELIARLSKSSNNSLQLINMSDNNVTDNVMGEISESMRTWNGNELKINADLNPVEPDRLLMKFHESRESALIRQKLEEAYRLSLAKKIRSMNSELEELKGTVDNMKAKVKKDIEAYQHVVDDFENKKVSAQEQLEKATTELVNLQEESKQELINIARYKGAEESKLRALNLKLQNQDTQVKKLKRHIEKRQEGLQQLREKNRKELEYKRSLIDRVEMEIKLKMEQANVSTSPTKNAAENASPSLTRMGTSPSLGQTVQGKPRLRPAESSPLLVTVGRSPAGKAPYEARTASNAGSGAGGMARRAGGAAAVGKTSPTAPNASTVLRPSRTLSTAKNRVRVVPSTTGRAAVPARSGSARTKSLRGVRQGIIGDVHMDNRGNKI